MPRKATKTNITPAITEEPVLVTMSDVQPTNGHSTAAEVEQAAGQLDAGQIDTSAAPAKKEKDKFAGLRPTKKMQASIRRLADAFEDVIEAEEEKHGTTPMIVAAAFGAVLFHQGAYSVEADHDPLAALAAILGRPVEVVPTTTDEPEKE